MSANNTSYEESGPNRPGPASNRPVPRARPRGSRWPGRLLHHLPSVVVFAGLGALFWWGHRTGWSIPSFAHVAGASVATEKEDWCAAHNVPDSKCIACHPELAGADPTDWCKEHGVPESRCTVCHPEILTKGVAGDWCKEHGVPESNCTICHPEIAVRNGQAAASSGPTVTLDENVKPIRDPATCQTHAIRIQFASAEAVRKAGIELAPVEERPMADYVSGNGEIMYDQTRVAQVSARLPGAAWRVDAEIGQWVRRGDVLALVDAAEVGRAKAELLQAAALVEVRAKALERSRTSVEKRFGTEAELQEAEATLKEAKIRLFNARQALINLGFSVPNGQTDGAVLERSLQFLGLPEPIAKDLDPDSTTANLIPVVAPFDGAIVSRQVAVGEVVEPAKPLFVIADTRRMWLTIDVAQEHAPRIAIGQEAIFRPTTQPDEQARGTVAWVSTAADDKTRTVRVRVDLDNPEGKLLAHTFGTARIVVRKSANAVAVPNEAIHWEGCCNVVFVRLTDEIFQTRKVKLGPRNGGFTEVLVGVLPGEVLATAGSFVLKSELLKSNLGAGCVDD